MKKDILKVIAHTQIYGLDLYGIKHTNLDCGKNNLSSHFVSKLGWTKVRLKRAVSTLVNENIFTKAPAEAGMKFYSMSTREILKLQLKLCDF